MGAWRLYKNVILLEPRLIPHYCREYRVEKGGKWKNH